MARIMSVAEFAGSKISTPKTKVIVSAKQSKFGVIEEMIRQDIQKGVDIAITAASVIERLNVVFRMKPEAAQAKGSALYRKIATEMGIVLKPKTAKPKKDKEEKK